MITRRQMLTGVAGWAMTGCRPRARAGSEVVLYSSLDERYAVALGRLFERRTGIRVRLVSDTETAKSTGLVNRLIAESSRPVADVFLSGDILRAGQLKRHGRTVAWQHERRSDLPASAYDDPEGHWLASSVRLRVLIVHPTRAGRESRPSSMLDVAKPEFAPRSCLANPLFGTTSMHARVLRESMGAAGAKAFFELFSRNGGRMLASNGEVRRKVVSGEFAYGWTDSDDVSVALRDRSPVEYVIPDQAPGAMGVVVVPCTVCVVRDAPHPAEARELARFLASEVTEEWLARSEASHWPLNPRLEAPKTFGVQLAGLRQAEVAPERWGTDPGDDFGEFLEAWASRQRR